MSVDDFFHCMFGIHGHEDIILHMFEINKAPADYTISTVIILCHKGLQDIGVMSDVYKQIALK